MKIEVCTVTIIVGTFLSVVFPKFASVLRSSLINLVETDLHEEEATRI